MQWSVYRYVLVQTPSQTLPWACESTYDHHSSETHKRTDMEKEKTWLDNLGQNRIIYVDRVFIRNTMTVKWVSYSKKLCFSNEYGLLDNLTWSQTSSIWVNNRLYRLLWRIWLRTYPKNICQVNLQRVNAPQKDNVSQIKLLPLEQSRVLYVLLTDLGTSFHHTDDSR